MRRRFGFGLLIGCIVAAAAWAGYRIFYDVTQGPFGNDQETVARLTRELPAGLTLEEVQVRLHRMGIACASAPDATGMFRFSVKAQMLIRVDAELRFDELGRLRIASFKSVYMG